MTDSGYITNDNIEFTNHLGRGIATVGRALGIGASDAVKNTLSAYDKNTEDADASTMNPKPPGIDHAQKLAAKHKDTNTLASTVGIKSYKKGGKVKKTAVYKLHKGERVLNPKQTKKFEKKGGLAAVLGGR